MSDGGTGAAPSRGPEPEESGSLAAARPSDDAPAADSGSDGGDPVDAVAAVERASDPRALRVSVGEISRLPGDEPMTVAPSPVAIRPRTDELTTVGAFGGIGLVTGTDLDRSSAPSTVAPDVDRTVGLLHLTVDSRPMVVRIQQVDTAHVVLDLAPSGDDALGGGRIGGSASSEASSADDPASAGETTGNDAQIPSSSGPGMAPIRVRALLGPVVRRSRDGILVQEAIVDGWRFELEIESERRAALRERARRGHESAGHSGPLEIRAIIPGRIVGISVSPGDPVEAGQQLLVLEAMKMQNELRAPREGEIERIAVSVGQTVDVGNLLMVIS